MRLAIVGSTSFRTKNARQIACTIIEGFIRVHKPGAIISGGAVGVDTWAEGTAKFFGFAEGDVAPYELVIHRPKNHRWEPEGFKDRNILIGNDCTHLLAIRCRHSETYGSGWTADYAEVNGKTVWRVLL